MSHSPQKSRPATPTRSDLPAQGQDGATWFGERLQQAERARRQAIERRGKEAAARQEAASALAADPLSRRRFLQATALAAQGAGLGAATGFFARPANAATAPRIAIVGAGLAGLTAAYRLHKSTGWTATVYEASARVGGRVRTIRGMANGQTCEAGAGAIDTRAKAVRQLAREVGLRPLVNLFQNLPAGPYLYHFGGQFHDPAALEDKVAIDGRSAARQWRRTMNFVPGWNRSNPASRAIDQMTVAEYLAQNTSFSGDKALLAYQRTSLAAEYAGTIDEMSALVYVLKYADIWQGAWDERWVIPGGMDTLTTVLSESLPADSVRLGHRLVAVRQFPDGTVRLSFDQDGSTRDVTVDKAVIAIPPPVLNQVDLTMAGFDDRMMRVVRHEKLGGNCKLNFQFSKDVWTAQSQSGDAITDTATGWSWLQNHQGLEPATYISFNNFDYGAAPAHGVAPASVVAQNLAAIELLFPGAASHVITPHTYLDNWRADPFALGSYAYYAPGAFTDYAGYEGTRQGNVHFAGEHTAPYVDRGFMNGAVISGERVAAEIATPA